MPKKPAMKCPNCHAENREDSRFCSQCAAPLGSGAEAPSLTRTLETPVQVIKQGTMIADKYRIVEEIGQGGMGIVYKAEDVRLLRMVALKFLPPHLPDSAELKERFLIEARAAAALSHPNICVIHEVGESEQLPYIAMEYVEGESLRDKIKKGPLKAEAALDISIQVATGLGEAHRKGIIHRDVKSANIMVTDKGQAKVMDFGLAKLRGGASLTKSMTTLGTVSYMSPEQARGDNLDGAPVQGRPRPDGHLQHLAPGAQAAVEDQGRSAAGPGQRRPPGPGQAGGRPLSIDGGVAGGSRGRRRRPQAA
jgi:serine/threonine protein kinase